MESLNKQLEELLPTQVKIRIENTHNQFLLIRDEISTTRKQYSELIKFLYRNHKPFNHQLDFRDTESSFAEDLVDFRFLIRVAWEADDISILDEFAIDYPFDFPSVMSKELYEYIDIFEQTVARWDEYMEVLRENDERPWPTTTKPFWAYLAAKFRYRIERKK